MKHLKIIITLAVVVLVASLMVFFVEGLTTPIIDDYQFEQANKAKFEIVPELTEDGSTLTDVSADYDLADSSITKIELVNDGEDLAVIYTVKFTGFEAGNIYIVAISLDTGNILGFRTVNVNETKDLGAVIEEASFQAQLLNLSTASIDDIGGTTAVVTLGGLKSSLKAVVLFHSVEFEGATVETPEERILRLKTEITDIDAVLTDVSSDYDLSSSPITKVEETDGNKIVYTVEVDGYNPGIIYLVAFDKVTNDIIGFRVIEQFETSGLGAVIIEDTFQAQFDDLAQDEIDSIAGTTAVITLGAIKSSLEDVVDFHKAEIEGSYVESYEEMIVRYKEEISVEDAIITDASGDYDLTDSNVLKVEMANDGSEDVAVIYTVEFVAYNDTDVIEYLISFDLVTNDVIGFRVTYQNETAGYGSEIENEDYWIQFEGMDQLDAFDGNIDAIAGTSGAPVTTEALKVSLAEIVAFHQVEFQGVVLETDAERSARLMLELFPTATDFIKVTRDNPAHYDIEEFYEAYNGATYLGNLYHVKAVGASYSEETYLEFYLGISVDETFTGLRMWDDNETVGKATSFYLVEYGDSYFGDNIETAYTIDDVAGSTLTNIALQNAALEIARYHVEVLLGREFARPANQDTSGTNILNAFPGADSYVSVYEDYAYNSTIYNIYEVMDGGIVIGYVYYGNAAGNGGVIEFAWGINLVDSTSQLIIVSDNETWQGAEDWGQDPPYDGGEGIFPDTPWLNNFENKALTTLLTNHVDDVAGVSVTTNGMRTALEIIAQYHIDESVGGAG